MRHTCEQCRETFDVHTPGDHVCPRCGRIAHLEAAGFDWESGVHLDDPPRDDRDAPTAGLAEHDAPVAPVAGHLCESCNARTATRACPTCHRLVCDACMRPDPAGGAVCAACASGEGVDFDTVTSSTFFTKIFPAITQVAFHPGEFFSRLRIPGPLWPAIIFGVIVAFPGGVMEQITSLLFQGNLVDLMTELHLNLPEDVTSNLQTGFQVGSVLGAVVFLPIALLAGIFINGAITHLMLMILGGANAKIEDTIRVVGYGNVSAIAKIVPVLGSLIAYGWNIVVVATGLTRVHRIPGWKAVAAILAPQLLCCCLASAAVVGLIALIGSMGLMQT